jgi:hypothetical protein
LTKVELGSKLVVDPNPETRMLARILRYAGYIFIWPLSTAVTYLLSGGGSNIFVAGAVSTLVAVIVLGYFVSRTDGLEGVLVLVLGWGATVVAIMHATWPRWVTPFELPDRLISTMLWCGTATLAANLLLYITKRFLASPLATPLYLARGYYLLFFGGPDAS